MSDVSMIACQLLEPGGPVVAREVARPVPGPGDVVVDVRAAGVCRSDLHYRSGALDASHMPRTLGHEIAGVVAAVGADVHDVRPGDAVAVHYVVACGSCEGCRHGEQFCERGAMIGKERDGGFAEQVVVPARNAVRIPDGVPIEHAAVMMCSTATAFHALRLADARASERALILGFGGLGISLAMLCAALGLAQPIVVEPRAEKRRRAQAMGALAVEPEGGALEALAAEFRPDVAFDFVGDPALSARALRLLAPGGRLMMVALARAGFDFDPYRDLLTGERRIVGCSDHTRQDVEDLLAMAAAGTLDLSAAVTRTLGMSAEAVNGTLDRLREGTDDFRTVLVRP